MNSMTVLEGIQKLYPNLKHRIEDTSAARFMDVSIGDAGVVIRWEANGKVFINHLPVREDDPANEYSWKSEQEVVDYVTGYFARKTETLPHTETKVGHKCGICRQTIHKQFVARDIEEDIVCSAFCVESSDKELYAFRDASPGTFCVYPCPGCGKAMEDAWSLEHKHARCSECAEAERLNSRTQALRKCRDLLEGSAFKVGAFDALRAEIDKALED